MTSYEVRSSHQEKERGLSDYGGSEAGRPFDSNESRGGPESAALRDSSRGSRTAWPPGAVLSGAPNHRNPHMPRHPAPVNTGESGVPTGRSPDRETSTRQGLGGSQQRDGFTPLSSQVHPHRRKRAEETSGYKGTRPYSAEIEASKRRQQEAGIAALVSLAIAIPTTLTFPAILTVPPPTAGDSRFRDETVPSQAETNLRPKRWIRNWARLREDHLIRNSLYLILSSGTQAALGFVFWIIAARLFAAGDVGRASSLISATGVIATIALLGLNSAVDRYLPTAPNQDGLITAALLLVGVSGAGAGLLYLFLTPAIAPRLVFVIQSPLLATGFVILTAFTAVNLLTDSVFITSRRASYTALTDGGIGGLTKVVSAVLLAGSGAYGLYCASIGGFAVAALASLALMATALHWRPSPRKLVQTLKPFARFSIANYISGNFYLLPSLIVPLIVLDRLGSTETAYYFVAFQVASLLHAVIYAIGQTFMAEGSYADADLRNLLKRSFRVLAAFVLPASLVLAGAAHWVLLVFGTKYSQHGTLPLILLVTSSIPLAVNHWLGTVLRLLGRLRAIIVNGFVFAAAICGFAWFLAPYGLGTLTSAWAIGGLLTAGVAAVPYRAAIRRQQSIGRARHRRRS